MYFSKMIMGLVSLASLAAATAIPEASSSSSGVTAVEVRRDTSSIHERTWGLFSSSSSSSFSCPKDMSYCGWTKSCSCAPGKYWDDKNSCCKGTALKGAWPKPSASVYGSVSAKLGAYCACSPYKIVPYDASHSYCQASLKNVVFLAPIEIQAELKLKAGVSIDVGSCSKALKHTCAGLAGLYLESSADAVALFNTGTYGLSVGVEGVVGAIAVGILKTVQDFTCWLGITKCATYDCVSYCTKGCKNYIDVKGKVGGFISGLVGFCILPDVIYTVGAAGAIVTVGVKSLLCIVGNIIKSVLSSFDCGCA